MSLEGLKAPDFTLAGSDGKSHALKDYAGRTVVIYFYPRDNTPGCTKEACAFRELKPELDRLGIVLFGVSRDSMNSHDKFIAAFGLPFTLLSDPEAAMMTAGPGSPFRRIDSEGARRYCTSEKSKSVVPASMSDSRRSKISGWSRNTAVTSRASGLSTKMGISGMAPLRQRRCRE